MLIDFRKPICSEHLCTPDRSSTPPLRAGKPDGASGTPRKLMKGNLQTAK